MDALKTYRAKRTDFKHYESEYQYVYGYLLGNEIHVNISTQYEWNGIDIIPASLAIYTGLDDKNDKPIFASLEIDGKMTKGGDIIDFENHIFKLIYMKSKMCFSLDSDARFMDFMCTTYSDKLTLGYVSKIEIIGNQYDNDLLTPV